MHRLGDYDVRCNDSRTTKINPGIPNDNTGFQVVRRVEYLKRECWWLGEGEAAGGEGHTVTARGLDGGVVVRVALVARVPNPLFFPSYGRLNTDPVPCQPRALENRCQDVRWSKKKRTLGPMM
ncbi:hypothetical protein Pmani_008087 [Petrolisthes manimaculis]|uniref:Uncharacterized protein n=1 Tax=Petrolisthes manimaculis TaxID=1843537 RepID=A0AAE1Q7M5_9EUCA|nr:hypothetical protein Pmani_008087 [Petrolisthes manimaculis]